MQTKLHISASRVIFLYHTTNALTHKSNSHIRRVGLTLSCACRLEECSPLICQLPCLQRLNLGHNHIVKLPNELSSLQHLHTLNVSHNRLAGLPSSLSACPSLADILAAGNVIASLPEQLSEMTNLRSLQLDDNR